MRNETIIYQLTREDLRQELRELLAEIRTEDDADRKRDGDQELETIPNTAIFLRVAPQTIRNMIDRGCIRAVRVGRRVMCDMAQLRKDVEAGKVGRGKHTQKRR